MDQKFNAKFTVVGQILLLRQGDIYNSGKDGGYQEYSVADCPIREDSMWACLTFDDYIVIAPGTYFIENDFEIFDEDGKFVLDYVTCDDLLALQKLDESNVSFKIILLEGSFNKDQPPSTV